MNKPSKLIHGSAAASFSIYVFNTEWRPTTQYLCILIAHSTQHQKQSTLSSSILQTAIYCSNTIAHPSPYVQLPLYIVPQSTVFELPYFIKPSPVQSSPVQSALQFIPVKPFDYLVNLAGVVTWRNMHNKQYVHVDCSSVRRRIITKQNNGTNQSVARLLVESNIVSALSRRLRISALYWYCCRPLVEIAWP